MEAEFRRYLQMPHATPVGKTSGREKGNCRQDKEGEKNEVRQRAEGKPRRSHQQAEREKRDDKSLLPFLSGAAQETGQHGEQRDCRVNYPTRGGILVLMGSRGLHGISHQPRQTVMVWESLLDSISSAMAKQDDAAADSTL